MLLVIWPIWWYSLVLSLPKKLGRDPACCISLIQLRGTSQRALSPSTGSSFLPLITDETPPMGPLSVGEGRGRSRALSPGIAARVSGIVDVRLSCLTENVWFCPYVFLPRNSLISHIKWRTVGVCCPLFLQFTQPIPHSQGRSLEFLQSPAFQLKRSYC